MIAEIGLLLWMGKEWSAGSPQETSPPKKWRLERIYEEGESQAYDFSVEVKFGEEGSLEISGRFTRQVRKLLPEGWADMEIRFETLTRKFSGQEFPGEVPDAVTQKFDKHGMPASFDLDSDDFSSIVLLGGYLPAQELEVGGKFPIKWTAEDKKVKIEGEGQFLATGRLYEEHVAKIFLRFSLTPEGESPGEFEITAYVNSKSGKLVKAEGTFKVEGDEADLEGKFVVGKVRSGKE